MDKPICNPNDAAKDAAEASALDATSMLEAAEIGWADYDAGRLIDFDPEDIKARGRERLASRVRDL